MNQTKTNRTKNVTGNILIYKINQTKLCFRFNSTVPLAPSRPRVTFFDESPGVATLGSTIRCADNIPTRSGMFGMSFDDRHRGRLLHRRRHRGDERLDSVRFYSTSDSHVGDDLIDVQRKSEVFDEDRRSSETVSLFRKSPFVVATMHNNDIPSSPTGDPPHLHPGLRELGSLAAIVWNVLALVDALIIWRRATATYVGALRIWRRLSASDFAVERQQTLCDECKLRTGNGSLYSYRFPSNVVEQSSEYLPNWNCRCYAHARSQVSDQCPAVNGRLNAARGRDQSCDDIGRHDVVRGETSVSMHHHQRHRRWRRTKKDISTGCDAVYRCVVLLLSDVTLPIFILSLGSIILFLNSAGLVSTTFVGFLRPLANTLESTTSPFEIVDSSHGDDLLNFRSGGTLESHRSLVDAIDTGLTQTSAHQLSALHAIIDAFNAGESQKAPS